MTKARKQGSQYRQMLLEQQGQRAEEEEPVSFFRIRFYLCLCLFAAYMILDYTKASVYSVDSACIYEEIGRDMTEELDLTQAWTQVMDSITKEIYIK